MEEQKAQMLNTKWGQEKVILQSEELGILNKSPSVDTRAIPKPTSDWLEKKKKRVGIAPNHKLSSTKQSLFSLNTNPHAFLYRSNCW
jgi:hypothetical protein